MLQIPDIDISSISFHCFSLSKPAYSASFMLSAAQRHQYAIIFQLFISFAVIRAGFHQSLPLAAASRYATQHFLSA